MVARREGPVLGRGNLDFVGSDNKSPSGLLYGTSEVSTMLLGLCASRHPGTQGGLPSNRKVTPGKIPPDYIPQDRETHARLDNHGISGHTCEAVNTRPDLDGKRQLDRVMHGHQAPSQISTGPHQVPIQVPYTNPD